MSTRTAVGCGAFVLLAWACSERGSDQPAPGQPGDTTSAGAPSPVQAGNAGSAGSGPSHAGAASGGTTGGKATGGSATGGNAAGGNAAGVNATGGSATGGNATGGNATGEAGATNDAGAGGGGDSTILEPASGALIGLYYGDESVAATTQKLGRSLPLHLTYYAWSDDWTKANTASDIKAGRVPFVNWELYEGGDLDQIIAGDFDAMLEQRATAAKALGKPLFLDLGAEMNGDWSPWSGAENGKSSDKFVAMYRHVHDQLQSADNVIWVWCPNVTDEPREAWNEALDYYPGDAYVDWTCVDGYNWGSSNGGGWQSFESVFRDIYPKLASKHKPIMIGEMASAEVGGDKAAWIAQIIPTLKSDYPLIKGLLWFDVDKETDWRISSSTASEAAFKTMVSDPYFNP
jgi:hypothetical protein